MDRVKEVLTLAPFAALAIGVLYIQGYWGHFGIVALPLLGFQELVAYSSVPLFGVVLLTVAGIAHGFFVGKNEAENNPNSGSRTFRYVASALMVVVAAITIYVDTPEKYQLVPALLIAATIGLIGREVLDGATPSLVRLLIPAVMITFIMVETFGFGRASAERLLRAAEPNAKVTVDSGTETGKLLGKLGSYYFFLNASNAVIQLPEKVIQRIEYIKKHE